MLLIKSVFFAFASKPCHILCYHELSPVKIGKNWRFFLFSFRLLLLWCKTGLFDGSSGEFFLFVLFFFDFLILLLFHTTFDCISFRFENVSCDAFFFFSAPTVLTYICYIFVYYLFDSFSFRHILLHFFHVFTQLFLLHLMLNAFIVHYNSFILGSDAIFFCYYFLGDCSCIFFSLFCIISLFFSFLHITAIFASCPIHLHATDCSNFSSVDCLNNFQIELLNGFTATQGG